MPTERSFRFSRAIVRRPGADVVDGLRMDDRGDPDPEILRSEHAGYVRALREAGVEVDVLPPAVGFPDALFVEDAALCLGRMAVLTRPGAPSRSGEPELLREPLERYFDSVVDLPGGDDARVDAGDVLVTESEVFIGLSQRTRRAGFEALSGIVSAQGYRPRLVETPPSVLHFKSDCSLLDAETVFATPTLAATGCFDGYQVIETPDGEPAAANLIRVNEHLLVQAGFSRTEELLDGLGYRVISLPLHEVAKIDGGPSCLSLRF